MSEEYFKRFEIEAKRLEASDCKTYEFPYILGRQGFLEITMAEDKRFVTCSLYTLSNRGFLPKGREERVLQEEFTGEIGKDYLVKFYDGLVGIRTEEEYIHHLDWVKGIKEDYIKTANESDKSHTSNA